MTKMPETKESALHEKHSWEDIIRDPKWIVYKRLVAEHCVYLQREVNIHLRNHEDRRAGEALRALDDCNKILDLISTRLKMLNDQLEKGASK